MLDANRVRKAFEEQASWCTKLGSPFTALICSLLAARLSQDTHVGQRVLAWDGDPSSQGDALPLRVCGALHALARRDATSELAAVYPPAPTPSRDTLWRAMQAAIERYPAHFDSYLATAPQTNEVGRSGALICGFLAIARRTRLPLHLFEIGSSAGLNLIPDRYRYRFGAAEWGDPHARLLIEPEWHGATPPVDADLRVAGRRGVDIAPLDISLPDERERLISYVWADQIDRLARLEAAIATALVDPPRVERMEAAEWVEKNIPCADVEPGGTRVLFHSVLWRYLTAETQQRITAHMDRCASAASPEHPLAWLRFELDASPAGASLTLKVWPPGEESVLASSQPHGSSITYLG